MFAKIPEKQVQAIRVSIAISWLFLIFSLFYDPISAHLIQPVSDRCIQFQGECLKLVSYPIGARLFWSTSVPLAIMLLLVFGHESWRRICPLSFMSQIPRFLKWQRKRVVEENSWLDRNHAYLQFGLLFAGLNLRLLLVNSDRLLLGIFLLLTILAAISVGFLYDGKAWCHYFCPMAPVQTIYSEPGGLLSSSAHQAPPTSITQSMCRTVDKFGREKSACVGCKASCMDIDAEKSYWDSINRGDRKLIYYGYIGLVIGFYLYFWLYSGNWNFYPAGVWHQTNLSASLLSPGFYFSDRAIPIPKLLAVPLTLTVCCATTYALGLWAEKAYKRFNRHFKRPLSKEQIHNRAFAIATFVAFNLLFFLGIRPTLTWLPLSLQHIVPWCAVLVSSLWLYKTWHRSLQKYLREKEANLLRYAPSANVEAKEPEAIEKIRNQEPPTTIVAKNSEPPTTMRIPPDLTYREPPTTARVPKATNKTQDRQIHLDKPTQINNPFKSKGKS